MNAREIERSAVLSDDGRYRYRLDRVWEPRDTPAVFVMLNPSTADATVDDPTIRRCIRFARDWGYGGLVVVNLFAWRATKPADLLVPPMLDKIGPDNDRHLRATTDDDGRLVVCAWGAVHKRLAWRAREVAALLPAGARCLGRTASGAPRHPLYVSADVRPDPFLPAVPPARQASR